jgi:hypothetical protein
VEVYLQTTKASSQHPSADSRSRLCSDCVRYEASRNRAANA